MGFIRQVVLGVVDKIGPWSYKGFEGYADIVGVSILNPAALRELAAKIDLLNIDMDEVSDIPPPHLLRKFANSVEDMQERWGRWLAKVDSLSAKSIVGSLIASVPVGTDTATILSIAPEQLVHLIENGRWVKLYQAGEYERAEKVIRKHGGAVFHTGGDGSWDVEVVVEPGHVDVVREQGPMKPYGTSEYDATEVTA